MAPLADPLARNGRHYSAHHRILQALLPYDSAGRRIVSISPGPPVLLFAGAVLAFEVCPDCGVRVRRLLSVCSVDTKPSTKSQLSDKNLKRLGFTKLVNEGGGKFRKTV